MDFEASPNIRFNTWILRITNMLDKKQTLIKHNLGLTSFHY